MAYDCSSSAPIVKQDALNLVSGLSAFLEWQSTLSFLKDPPSGYAFPAIDLLGGMQDLYDQVNAGKFANEVDFQTNLTTLLGQAHEYVRRSIRDDSDYATPRLCLGALWAWQIFVYRAETRSVLLCFSDYSNSGTLSLTIRGVTRLAVTLSSRRMR